MKRTFIYVVLALFCLVLTCFPIVGEAKEKEKSTDAISGFSYEVLYPENQTNKELGYFDLTMAPGQKQTVSLKLYNASPKELLVQIRLNTAKTNSNGKVEYGPSDLQTDSSLTMDFTDIVKGPTKVIVPPNGSKQVDLAISLPESAFNGLIVGGIQLQPSENNISDRSKKKDVVINEYAFLVGLLIRVGDTSKIKPTLTLNKTYIAFKDGKNHLFVEMSNSQPVYAEGMSVTVQVRKSNKQKVLFDYTSENLRMAPNSIFDLPIDLSDKQLTAGTYTAQIDATTKNGESWSWTDDFKVTKLEAEQMSQQAENNGESFILFWVIAGFIGLVIIGLLVTYLVRKHKRLNGKKRLKYKSKN